MNDNWFFGQLTKIFARKQLNWICDFTVLCVFLRCACVCVYIQILIRQFIFIPIGLFVFVFQWNGEMVKIDQQLLATVVFSFGLSCQSSLNPSKTNECYCLKYSCFDAKILAVGTFFSSVYKWQQTHSFRNSDRFWI